MGRETRQKAIQPTIDARKQLLIDRVKKYKALGVEELPDDKTILKLSDQLVKVNLYTVGEKALPVMRKKLRDLADKVKQKHADYTKIAKFPSGGEIYQMGLAKLDTELVRLASKI